MRPFEYLRAGTAVEACAFAAGHVPDVRFLAGGTDLLLELRRSAARSPRVVVDVNGIREMCGIEKRGEAGIVLGALATHTEIGSSSLVQACAPLLSAAARGIGSVQIRNRGTVGGNIMNAAACADTVPPLIALGATVALQSPGGVRRVPLDGFFVKPYVTKAQPGELLTGIYIPALPSRTSCGFVKLGRRNALAIARLSVAAILCFDDRGMIADARIVPGAAFPVWQRVTEAEQMLIAQKPSLELFRAAGQKVSAVMISVTGRRWSTEYKGPVIGALVRRALELCKEEP